MFWFHSEAVHHNYFRITYLLAKFVG